MSERTDDEMSVGVSLSLGLWIVAARARGAGPGSVIMPYEMWDSKPGRFGEVPRLARARNHRQSQSRCIAHHKKTGICYVDDAWL